jgi:cardiolipin synthase
LTREALHIAAEAFFVSEWIIRLVMLVYVPQRRTPAAARSWLLLIFVEPWVGLLLYSIFGRAALSQRRSELQDRFAHLVATSEKEVFGPYAAHAPLPCCSEQTATLARHLSGLPILEGNQVELLPDYEGSVERLVQDIRAARHHVHLLYYIFADDRVGGEVIAALRDAVKRGVQCRVLLDSLGSKHWRRAVVARLREAGVETREMLPVHLFRLRGTRFDLRNHRKIAVIDGRVGYVGSQNLVEATFKPGIVYKELVARVKGPVVLQLQGVFLADHFFESGTRLEEDAALFPAQERAGGALAQVLASGPGYTQAANQRLIVALVHGACRRVVLSTPYFIPDEALLQALQTAVLRGVEVHLIVSHKADQLLVGLAQRSYYEDLLRAGVQIHQYRTGFLHAKHVSVDSIAVIGSSNLDIRSFQLNAEVSLIVYDEGVTAALREEEERNMADADVLTLEEWQKRPFLTRTAQNLARLVDSLL